MGTIKGKMIGRWTRGGRSMSQNGIRRGMVTKIGAGLTGGEGVGKGTKMGEGKEDL